MAGDVGGEAFEGVFFVDGIGSAADEDGFSGEGHATGDDGDEAVPGVLRELATEPVAIKEFLSGDQACFPQSS